MTVLRLLWILMPSKAIRYFGKRLCWVHQIRDIKAIDFPSMTIRWQLNSVRIDQSNQRGFRKFDDFSMTNRPGGSSQIILTVDERKFIAFNREAWLPMGKRIYRKSPLKWQNGLCWQANANRNETICGMELKQNRMRGWDWGCGSNFSLNDARLVDQSESKTTFFVEFKRKFTAKSNKNAKKNKSNPAKRINNIRKLCDLWWLWWHRRTTMPSININKYAVRCRRNDTDADSVLCSGVFAYFREECRELGMDGMRWWFVERCLTNGHGLTPLDLIMWLISNNCHVICIVWRLLSLHTHALPLSHSLILTHTYSHIKSTYLIRMVCSACKEMRGEKYYYYYRNKNE